MKTASCLRASVIMLVLVSSLLEANGYAAQPSSVYRIDLTGSAHWINVNGVQGRYNAKATVCAKQDIDGKWSYTTMEPEHLTVYFSKSKDSEFARFHITDGRLDGTCDVNLSMTDCPGTYDPANPPYCASAHCPLIGDGAGGQVTFPLPNGNAIYDPLISSASKTSPRFAELPVDPNNCPGGACGLMLPTGGSPAPWEAQWSRSGVVRMNGDIPLARSS